MRQSANAHCLARGAALLACFLGGLVDGTISRLARVVCGDEVLENGLVKRASKVRGVGPRKARRARQAVRICDLGQFLTPTGLQWIGTLCRNSVSAKWFEENLRPE